MENKQILLQECNTHFDIIVVCSRLMLTFSNQLCYQTNVLAC